MADPITGTLFAMYFSWGLSRTAHSLTLGKAARTANLEMKEAEEDDLQHLKVLITEVMRDVDPNEPAELARRIRCLQSLTHAAMLTHRSVYNVDWMAHGSEEALQGTTTRLKFWRNLRRNAPRAALGLFPVASPFLRSGPDFSVYADVIGYPEGQLELFRSFYHEDSITFEDLRQIQASGYWDSPSGNPRFANKWRELELRGRGGPNPSEPIARDSLTILLGGWPAGTTRAPLAGLSFRHYVDEAWDALQEMCEALEEFHESALELRRAKSLPGGGSKGPRKAAKKEAKAEIKRQRRVLKTAQGRFRESIVGVEISGAIRDIPRGEVQERVSRFEDSATLLQTAIQVREASALGLTVAQWDTFQKYSESLYNSLRRRWNEDTSGKVNALFTWKRAMKPAVRSQWGGIGIPGEVMLARIDSLLGTPKMAAAMQLLARLDARTVKLEEEQRQQAVELQKHWQQRRIEVLDETEKADYDELISKVQRVLANG